MKPSLKILFFITLVFGVLGFVSFRKTNPKILAYTVNLEKQNLKFFWKDDEGHNFQNFRNLKKWLKKKDEKLIFAMNGGMYLKNRSPQGLYIENGQELSSINTIQKAYGNFYLQPNGIFYITQQNNGVVCPTKDFSPQGVKYATQSGPMLVINGQIHPAFRNGSKNLHIRNGVGILPDGQVLFAISKEKINLYDFATYFQSMGCTNALYLDGFVSRVYLPAKGWNKLNGRFGVIIGVVQ